MLCLLRGLPRGDLQPGEDLGDFSPNYLRKRTPSLALVALFAILDPPREEAIEAAKVAHNAGITVKMITGVCVCVGCLTCITHTYALHCKSGERFPFAAAFIHTC